MKKLHIMNDDKFIKPYIRAIEKYFNFNEHQFVIFTKENNDYYNKHNNIYLINNKKKYLYLEKKLYKANKIFLHGLFIRNIIIILFMQPWLLRKSKWILWGGDLYKYKKQKNKNNLKSKIYEFMRSTVIKNVEGIISYIKGDYNLAKKWYATNANYYNCIGYLSNIHEYNINFEFNQNYKKNKYTFIQVGNSADPSNNHLEILDKIKEHYNDDKNIKIICPLSYGNKEQAKKVIFYGKKIFNKDFVPLTKFLDIDVYNKLLSNIDIAIFNHERQQAMGNILTLLYLGKKVYIRDDIVTWDFFDKNNIEVFSFNNNNEKLLNKIDEETSLKNHKIIKSKFNIENFI